MVREHASSAGRGNRKMGRKPLFRDVLLQHQSALKHNKNILTFATAKGSLLLDVILALMDERELTRKRLGDYALIMGNKQLRVYQHAGKDIPANELIDLTIGDDATTTSAAIPAIWKQQNTNRQPVKKQQIPARSQIIPARTSRYPS